MRVTDYFFFIYIPIIPLFDTIDSNGVLSIFQIFKIRDFSSEQIRLLFYGGGMIIIENNTYT